MIKFKQGDIINMKGDKMGIIVKAKAPNSLKDSLVGGVITLMGITYLTYTAFRKGSKTYQKAELRTMRDLDII